MQSFVDAMARIGITITQDQVYVTFIGTATASSRRLDASGSSGTNITVAIALPSGTSASTAASNLNNDEVTALETRSG